MIPLFRVKEGARSDWARDVHDDRVEDVMDRVADELRSIRGPLPAAEVDAIAHDIVLDVARFVLRWVEGADPEELELGRVGGDGIRSGRVPFVRSPERLAG